MIRRRPLLTMVCALFASGLGAGAAGDEAYGRPPAALEELVLAPRPQALEADPGRRWLLVAEPADLMPVEQLAWPEERLRGLRFYPAAAARVEALEYAALGVCPLRRAEPEGMAARCRWWEEPVDGARLRAPIFSPSGDGLAFGVLRADGLELHLAEVPSGRSRRLATVRLHDLLGPPCSFWPDGGSLLCRAAAERPAAAERLAAGGQRASAAAGDSAAAPQIRDATAEVPRSAGARPSPRLLAALDSRILRIYRDGRVEELAPAGPWSRAQVSPDGRWLLVERLGVSPERFLLRSTDGSGELRPLLAPRRGSLAGVAWRADAPATLSWFEARLADGGAAGGAAGGNGSPANNELWLWAAPWTGPPARGFSTDLRLQRILWAGSPGSAAAEGSWAVAEVFEPPRGPSERWAVPLPGGSPAANAREPVMLARWSPAVTFGDPADPLLRSETTGLPTLERAADGRFWVRGQERVEEGGLLPTLGLQDPATGEVEVLWRSPPQSFERPVAMMPGSEPAFLAVREAEGEPGNLFLHRLEEDGDPVPITGWGHPAAELAAVAQQRLSYRREDGLPLSARLYLPPEARPEEGPEREKPPVIFWAYPQDLDDTEAGAAASQPAVRSLRLDPLSPLVWLVRGYAVLEAEMPIVGEDEAAPNDSWRQQLVADATAALDAAAATGRVDTDRAVVVGHSYGAHMAAALLAHTDLFRAGIALSGAYNRTLTPFGFQDEERSLWQAPEVYRNMSPLLDADRIEEPLLLIHGQQDSHQATRPEQSEALYEALRFLGRPARLVLLPHEGHRPRGRESVLHLLWEMDRWLTEYLSLSP